MLQTRNQATASSPDRVLSGCPASRLHDLAERRIFQEPLERLRDQERKLDDWEGRLKRSMVNCLQKARHQADAQAARLESLSPLNVLARGYSLTRTWPERQLVSSVQSVRAGDRLEILFRDGKLRTLVEEIEPNS